MWRKFIFLTGMVALLMAIAGCGDESTEKQEAGSASTGISGSVKYTGAKKGGILIYATDQLPKPGEAPQPKSMSEFNDVTGEFDWSLPAGTYYINAFLAVDRQPQGPPQPDEPAVNCNAINLKADESIKIEVKLTDADTGGNKDCIKK